MAEEEYKEPWFDVLVLTDSNYQPVRLYACQKCGGVFFDPTASKDSWDRLSEHHSKCGREVYYDA